MSIARVEGLRDLTPVFERLERGESVLLVQNAEEAFMSKTTPPRRQASRPPLTPSLSPSFRAVGRARPEAEGERAPSRRVRDNFTVGDCVADSLPQEVALGVRSSGTTGVPKITWHRWAQLRKDVHHSGSVRGWKWASPYRANSFAGVQVALQAWATGGSCLSLSRDLACAWRELEQHRPEALCCTPTYLQLLLLSESDGKTAPRWEPVQITLGGEPLRREVGRLAQERFPETRFTVIYASTELGVIARTHRTDGWFETTGLTNGASWRVVEGVLELWEGNSPNGWAHCSTEPPPHPPGRHPLPLLPGRRPLQARGHGGEGQGEGAVCGSEVHGEGGWHSTEDLVEVQGDLFRVLGRAAAVANVGGTKIQLAEVESVAEAVSGVVSARAWAESDPIVGQTVGLRFSVIQGRDPASVRVELERHLRGCLRKEAWPRRWELAEPALGPNTKKGL